jgi:RNA polymerase sigma-70 factor (ECF subfamily)
MAYALSAIETCHWGKPLSLLKVISSLSYFSGIDTLSTVQSAATRSMKTLHIGPPSALEPFGSIATGVLPGAEISTAEADAALMRAIADRDPDALATLYGGILKALVIRVIHDEAEADDLLQEIFMQIWRQAKNYSQKKGQALGWIVTLTRRRAIDRLRKRQAYHRVTERLELETERQPDSWVNNRIDNDILQEDLRQFLLKRIEALPALQRQAIDLAFFHGMSQREIAEHTNTPLGTIKTRLELGLRKLHDSVRGLRNKI